MANIDKKIFADPERLFSEEYVGLSVLAGEISEKHSSVSTSELGGADPESRATTADRAISLEHALKNGEWVTTDLYGVEVRIIPAKTLKTVLDDTPPTPGPGGFSGDREPRPPQQPNDTLSTSLARSEK